ncbi:MAG TPA: nucleotidyltransferase family protein [Acidimicrobiales bacterium]|nr:nucleotidyltransferase family protein [Acidimicrobiales bacterium]
MTSPRCTTDSFTTPDRRAVAELDPVNVRVFGSVARGEDRCDSDVDLLVDLAPGTGLVTLGTLERELGEVLGPPVDVVPADSLRAGVRAEAEREAIPL